MSPQTLQLLSALRRITQALDTHSKALEGSAGLTLSQVLVLSALRPETAPLSAGYLAQRVSLTQGTLTSILDRLEAKHLVTRDRAAEDRRRVLVTLTPCGHEVLAAAPPALQAHFVQQFQRLPAHRRRQVVTALEDVAAMMRVPEAQPVQVSAAV
jgi:DNA-binding MarR family transcriptional regulator